MRWGRVSCGAAGLPSDRDLHPRDCWGSCMGSVNQCGAGFSDIISDTESTKVCLLFVSDKLWFGFRLF